MNNTTTVSIRMDAGLKKQAEALFDEIGMNMTTAFTIFAKTAVRQQRIPFELEVNPFYSEMNMERISRAIDALDAGLGVEHELIEVDDE
jgi:DNA-damage-inducible protein J